MREFCECLSCLMRSECFSLTNAFLSIFVTYFLFFRSTLHSARIPAALHRNRSDHPLTRPNPIEIGCRSNVVHRNSGIYRFPRLFGRSPACNRSLKPAHRTVRPVNVDPASFASCPDRLTGDFRPKSTSCRPVLLFLRVLE